MPSQQKTSILINEHAVNREPGPLSNNDGDGNEDGKKKNKFISISKTNNYAGESRFFVHFLAVVARLQGERA